ncbi:MAG: hypothetical protein OXB84_02955, partial [Halobacteriovoraceae bacterium]|nr:hypothetical protein [Halobacteriovoraceae bacterium]
FHRYLWSHEQLEKIVDGIINDIVAYSSVIVSSIKDFIDVNHHPVPHQNQNQNISFSMWKIGRVKNILTKCNYSFRKTFDIVKKLSQNSCVDEIFLPAEKRLNNKSREEGIHFNTILFGEHTDRMAIKFKSTCE